MIKGVDGLIDVDPSFCTGMVAGPDSPDKIADFLTGRFPGLRIVGKYSPPFRSLTDEEDQEVCAMINEAKPDFVWVGLGSPKQDRWIHDHREKIRGAIFMPSGATFDFFSGRIRQAPKFIQNAGFEWLFRLTQDFRRLWVRYTVFNVIFLFAFGMQMLGIAKFNSPKSAFKPAERCLIVDDPLSNSHGGSLTT